VFYSNRAACEFVKFFAPPPQYRPLTRRITGYINMSPPKHELVVKDCDEALKLEPAYVKALNRRALALEGLERYEESLRGMQSYPPFLSFFTSHKCRLYGRNHPGQVPKPKYCPVGRTRIEKTGDEEKCRAYGSRFLFYIVFSGWWLTLAGRLGNLDYRRSTLSKPTLLHSVSVSLACYKR